MTLQELVEKFEYFMLNDSMYDEKSDTFVKHGNGKAEGFTIGNGKQLHWFIVPSARTGKYRCHQIYENGEIGRGRYIYPEHKVVIHYKEK